MKLLPRILFVALCAILASCQQDPQSPDSVMRQSPSGHTVVWNAHPTIVYASDTNIGTSGHPNSVRGLWVMDSNGLNWACIYYNSATSNDFWYPHWSPAGTSSVCFIENDIPNSTTGYYRLMRIDVGLSSGKPIGSNVTNLYTYTYQGDSTSIEACAWSPSSSANAIAYTTLDRRSGVPWTQKSATVQLISASGGTPTTVYSDTNSRFIGMSWSPDGSLIALRVIKPNNYHAIRVIDLSGNVRHEYQVTAFDIDYARTSGRLAYSTGSALYTLDTASGSSTLIRSVSAGNISWSPTDYKILYSAPSGTYGNNQPWFPISTIVAATGDTVRLRNPGGHGLSWKP